MAKDIKISEVLELLDNGKSREEIAEHFEITMADCKRMFNHPLLKGKKAKKQMQFNLVNDVQGSDTVIGEEISNESSDEETTGAEIAEPEVTNEPVASNWEN